MTQKESSDSEAKSRFEKTSDERDIKADEKAMKAAKKRAASLSTKSVERMIYERSFWRLSLLEQQFIAAKLMKLSYDEYRERMNDSRGNPDFVEIDFSSNLKS